MKKRKKIVVPIDFSFAAHNAYLYARALAKDIDASVEVIHAHKVTPDENNIDFPKKMEKLKGKISQFVNLYPRAEEEGSIFTTVEVTQRLIVGEVLKEIIRASQHPSTYMFVMGMTGAHNAVGRFLGTVSSSVARRANCPVLLIPNEVKYTPFKDVLFASNYESAERKKIKQLTEFIAHFNAGIHFVHVREKEEVEEFTQTEERIFERLFEEGDPAFRFNLTSIEAASVTKGLTQYADENNIDLMTVINSRKGFFELLFNKSIIKKIAFSTKLPLLVLHLIK